jgi:aromatic-L-amino-acid/L-tryptophan decarboxylase
MRLPVPETALEPGPEEMRAMLGAVADRLVHHVEALDRGRAIEPPSARDPGDLLREPLPEDGSKLDTVLDVLFEQVIPGGVDPASPGSLTFANGGGLVHAAAADLIAAVTNRYGGFWAAAPGVNAVEWTVVRWICDLVGLPPSSGGLLLTGGSMANLTALVTARHARLDTAVERGTVYASEEMHHSIRKAARVVGLPAANVRAIPTDRRLRMRPDLLQTQIERDRADGLAPFCVVGTAGSPNAGAVDDLRAVGEVSARNGLWFHVDAAYGGFFLLTSAGREALAGIDAADSVTLDPHKSLFLPFGTGSLVVRDLDVLRRAHTLNSSCVAGIAQDGDRVGGVNFADLSIEQTREARGLRVWLPLKLLGARIFREALEEKLELAALAAERVHAIPGLEIVVPPALSAFAFRLDDRWNGDAREATRSLVERVNRSGQVHLAMAEVDGRPVVRVCVLSFRTHRAHVDTLCSRLREAAEHLARTNDLTIGAPS